MRKNILVLVLIAGLSQFVQGCIGCIGSYTSDSEDLFISGEIQLLGLDEDFEAELTFKKSFLNSGYSFREDESLPHLRIWDSIGTDEDAYFVIADLNLQELIEDALESRGNHTTKNIAKGFEEGDTYSTDFLLHLVQGETTDTTIVPVTLEVIEVSSFSSGSGITIQSTFTVETAEFGAIEVDVSMNLGSYFAEGECVS